MKICPLSLQNHTSLNQPKSLSHNTVIPLQSQQSDNINYHKISPAQYAAQKNVSFGQSVKEASLQLIDDIFFLKKDDEAKLKSILNRIDNSNINVNFVDKDGWTPLISASRWGHTEIVEKLLSHPDIDVNLQNIWGWNALMQASRYGRTEVVEKLLTHPDIDIHLPNEDGQTALMLALTHGHTETSELIEKNISNHIKNLISKNNK